MSRKKNTPYIPNSELNRGIQLCDQNAKSLLEDAQLLFSKGSYGRSLSLAVLSMEEYAKKWILIARSLHPDKFDKEVRDAFRDHDLKLKYALLMLIREYPKAHPEDEILKIIEETWNKLEGLRLRGFYVDFWKERDRWLSPQDEECKRLAEVQIKLIIDHIKKIDSWVTEIPKKIRKTP